MEHVLEIAPNPRQISKVDNCGYQTNQIPSFDIYNHNYPKRKWLWYITMVFIFFIENQMIVKKLSSFC
jgi:hypothetical protein